MEAVVDPATDDFLVGSGFVGRVESVVASGNSAFVFRAAVDLSDAAGASCLSLSTTLELLVVLHFVCDFEGTANEQE